MCLPHEYRTQQKTNDKHIRCEIIHIFIHSNNIHVVLCFHHSRLPMYTSSFLLGRLSSVPISVFFCLFFLLLLVALAQAWVCLVPMASYSWHVFGAWLKMCHPYVFFITKWATNVIACFVLLKITFFFYSHQLLFSLLFYCCCVLVLNKHELSLSRP